MSLPPRVVVVYRQSEYDDLVARHGTPQAARFFLEERGRVVDDLVEAQGRQADALQDVSNAIPTVWRRTSVERAELPRFRFDDGDIVIAVGQDGLVANVAKYLDGQPVIGVNPDPDRIPGVLVRYRSTDMPELLVAAVAPVVAAELRTMVVATNDHGESIHALNEVFVGDAGHQSARYSLTVTDQAERQSSSGLLIGTGTGATGWLKSIARQCGDPITLPAPTEPTLAWFVREAWPSAVTGCSLVAGRLDPDEAIRIVVESDHLVCFGDGIEHDPLIASWGQTITVRRSERVLRLVCL